MNATMAQCQRHTCQSVVLVIGAGPSGLLAAATLLQAGFQVQVLEQQHDIGGCWLECSSEAKLQVPYHDYTLPGFPWPPSLTGKGCMPTLARHVLLYLKAFSQHHGLQSHIRLNCRVQSVEEIRPAFSSSLVSSTPWPSVRAGRTERWRVVLTDLQTAQTAHTTASFLVVATGLYSSPYIPAYPGQDTYKGQQLHAREVCTTSTTKGADVLVLGHSATPLDAGALTHLAGSARTLSLLYHKVHWPPPLDHLHNGGMKVLQTMPFYDLSKCAGILHELAAPMRKAACSRLQRKLRRKFQMDELSLVPADPLPLDILHGTHPVHEQDWAAGVRHPHTTLLEGRVRCFTPKGVLLDTGQEVPADLVVYCTGFKQAVHMFDATVVQRLRVADDGLYLYRGILHPDVDDLAFIGCGADTLNSLQTAGLQARWLASLLQGSLHLPSRAVQHADLTAQQVWRRSFFPAAHNRAARYAQYTVDYHAQLTRDMSCSSGQQEPGLLGTCLPCLARPVSRCPAASPQPCSQPSATTPNACHPTQQHLSPLGPRLAAPTLPVGHGPPSLHALYATWQLQPQPQHQAQPQYDQLAQHGGNGSTLVAPPYLTSPTLPAARSGQDPGASCCSPAAGLAAGLPLEVLGHAGAWVNEQGLLSLTSEAGRSSSSQTQLAFGHGGCEEVAGQCAGHAMQSGHWSDKSAAARSAGTMQPLSPVMEGYTTGHASPLTPMLCQEEASAPGGHWGGAVQQDGWPHVLSPAPHLSGAVQPAAAAATTLGTSARGAWARARAWAVGTASAGGAAGHAMAPALPPTAAVPPPASMHLTLAPADPDTGAGLGTHISLPDSTMPNQATALQPGGSLTGSLSLPQPGCATKPVSQAGAGSWIRSAIRRALWASASSLTPRPSSPASCLPAHDSAFSPDLPHSVSNGSVTPSTWTAFMSTSTSNARAQCQAASSPTTQYGWNSRLSSHPDGNQVSCPGRGQPAAGTSAQGNQADPPLGAAGGRGLGDSGGAAEDRPTDQPMPLRSRPPLSSSRSMRAPKDSLSAGASSQLQPGSAFTAGSHQLGGVTQNYSRETPADGTTSRTESHGEVIYPRPRLRQARGYDSAAGRTGHPSTAAADAGQEDAHDEEADENAQAAIMRQLQQRTHSAQQLAMYVMASSAAQQRTSRRTSRALSRARSITGRFGAQSASTEGQHSVGDRIRCQQTSMSFTAGATPGARTLQHNFMQARRSRLADVSLPGSPPSHNSSTSSLMVERGAMSTFNSSFTHSTLARRVTLTAGFTVAIQAADAAHPVLTSHQTTPARAAPVLRHTSQPGNQGLVRQRPAALPASPAPLPRSPLPGSGSRDHAQAATPLPAAQGRPAGTAGAWPTGVEADGGASAAAAGSSSSDSIRVIPAMVTSLFAEPPKPLLQPQQQQQQQQAALGVVPLQRSVLSSGSLGREVTASSLQADPLLHHSHQHHDHGMRQAQAAQAQAQAAQDQLSTPSAAPASPAAVRSCFAHAVALPAREQALAHASGRTPASVAEGGEAHTSHTTEAAACGALYLAAQGSAAAAEQRELGLTQVNGHVPKGKFSGGRQAAPTAQLAAGQARGPPSASPGQQQGVDPYQDKPNRVSDPASLLGLHSEPLSEPNSSLLGLLHIMEPNSSWGTDLSSRMSLMAGTNTATTTTSTPSAGVSALMSELSGLHAYTMPGNGMGSHSSRERSSRERSSRSSTALGTRQLALMAAAPAVAGVLEEEDKEAAAAGTAPSLC